MSQNFAKYKIGGFVFTGIAFSLTLMFNKYIQSNTNKYFYKYSYQNRFPKYSMINCFIIQYPFIYSYPNDKLFYIDKQIKK
jgi:hypothetical protein